MDLVIKIGGSLCKYPSALRELCKKLSEWLKGRRCIVTPGGGPFTDIVRQVQSLHNISDDVAHEMALLAVDQYGLMLSELIEGIPVRTLTEARKIVGRAIPVLLPSHVIISLDLLEHSWNAGSDCIAAVIAKACSARRLILVKDVDGIYDPNDQSKLLSEVSLSQLEVMKTCLDPLLPSLLRSSGIDCVVVNGLKPDRVRLVIEGLETTCTRILVS
ncbi:MAG: delta 1-pyrroline-5-carboxylate synthetase [Candidatus Nezhaarchaeota archaeon]|nr:delta 1-pyrroline-5-carboxylate synthetase [Candidatus Nezhaarchaeota archaeon]